MTTTTSAAAATSLVVFEGLPHQMWDKDLLAIEVKRKDTRKIWEYPFYTPGVEAKNGNELRTLLSNPATLIAYHGPKNCGGYHPDYCVSWQADEATHYALICFGCHEIVFYDGEAFLIYDLPDFALERYKDLLSIYAVKRPKTDRE